MKKSENPRPKQVSRLPSSIEDIGSHDQGNLSKNYNRAQRGAQVKAKQDKKRFGETWFGKMVQSPKARWLIRDGRVSWDLLLITVVGVGVLLAIGLPYLKSGLSSKVEAAKPERARLFHDPDQAKVFIDKFYAAKSVEEQLKLVRSPAKVEPLMRAYHQGEFKPWWLNQENEETMPAIIAKQYGRHFSLTGITFLDSMKEKVICIEDTPQGPKVDWETAVGYQPIDWTEFKKQQSRRVYQLRCIATKSDYFNFQFADPGKWTCYHLRDPYGDEEMYGYLPTASELRRRFDDQMRGVPIANLRAIFSVRFPENPKADNMVEITDDVIDDWFFNLADVETHPLLDSTVGK